MQGVLRRDKKIIPNQRTFDGGKQDRPGTKKQGKYRYKE